MNLGGIGTISCWGKASSHCCTPGKKFFFLLFHPLSALHVAVVGDHSHARLVGRSGEERKKKQVFPGTRRLLSRPPSCKGAPVNLFYLHSKYSLFFFFFSFCFCVLLLLLSIFIDTLCRSHRSDAVLRLFVSFSYRSRCV